jgi:hypothetical protein
MLCLRPYQLIHSSSSFLFPLSIKMAKDTPTGDDNLQEDNVHLDKQC